MFWPRSLATPLIKKHEMSIFKGLRVKKIKQKAIVSVMNVRMT